MKKRMLYFAGGIVVIGLILSVFYFSGPEIIIESLDTKLPELTDDLVSLEKMVNEKEQSFKDQLKPGNASRIVWADPVPSKTEYSFVYLHGWSASSEEGAPLHEETAHRYQANLYLPRLHCHGLKGSDSMQNLTAKNLMASAREAIAVASKLGSKVIVIATSTGASIAMYLAGYNPCIAALILYSPNIEIYASAAKLLGGPWGLQLARMLNGDYYEFEASETRKKFWTNRYRVEALPQLQALLNYTMVQETFKKVTQPVFMGYYYKNEKEQDKVVSVAAMLRMFEQLGTPQSLKRKKAFPNAGHHVLSSHIISKDLNSVKCETFIFLESKLGLVPVKP
ncbi:alpha/beta hydrolase [Flavobacteriaceae bacterium M23B6Z8]